MLFNKFSKMTLLMILFLIVVGLAACDNSSSSSDRPSNVSQEEPVVIEPKPEVTRVVEDNQNEADSSSEPVGPEVPDLDTRANEPFLMPIEDIFTIRGRGTVIVGTVVRGILEVGSEVEIVGVNETTSLYVVNGIERFNKTQEEALPDQQVGVLLRGARADLLQIGQVAAAPSSITAHTEFTADIQILTQAEGGRNRPAFNGYRPQFHLWTLEATGAMTLPDGVEMILPGEAGNVTVELIVPAALETGTTFKIMERDQLIATGVVTSIIR